MKRLFLLFGLLFVKPCKEPLGRLEGVRHVDTREGSWEYIYDGLLDC